MVFMPHEVKYPIISLFITEMFDNVRDTYGFVAISDQPIRNCNESVHGCCPDNKTAAPGAKGEGCPSKCVHACCVRMGVWA